MYTHNHNNNEATEKIQKREIRDKVQLLPTTPLGIPDSRLADWPRDLARKLSRRLFAAF